MGTLRYWELLYSLRPLTLLALGLHRSVDCRYRSMYSSLGRVRVGRDTRGSKIFMHPHSLTTRPAQLKLEQ